MHRGKIFVVDDLEDFRQLLEDVLSEQGYEVLSFERAADALAALQAQAPDLLITDIRLGNENGLGLVRSSQGQRGDPAATGHHLHRGHPGPGGG